MMVSSVGATSARARASQREYVSISQSRQQRIVEAARDERIVDGLTHNFYRYPARFSPRLARAAIGAFSSAGDLVLDPFVGGGTTLVEALAAGRRSIGSDISSLAAFISTAKTTLYSNADLKIMQRWAASVPEIINVRREALYFEEWAESGYYKHLAHPDRWRLRKAIEQALESAIALRPKRLERFARCAILRTAQWALDSRRKLASVSEFRSALARNTETMIAGSMALRSAVESHGHSVDVHCLHKSAEHLDGDPLFDDSAAPKLVLMSPPYPGVHVLYHRWQVDGRKETPAPFWIADKLDGSGGAYYTMGDRKDPELRTYFETLTSSLQSIARLCTRATTIVQVVAFSKPRKQLRKYLEACELAGLQEFYLPALAGERDGRLWRTVPNRRWYADQRGTTPGSLEVMLIHKRAPSLSPSPRSRRSARPQTNSPSRVA